ncbi:hypothetical protein K474DRAFT_1744707 [Panus rudis PR-1116 ss-1]|nr:hypothetical protein K474DRAFT_1744707 [Panus rudis PR-1116 ss-1]
MEEEYNDQYYQDVLSSSEDEDEWVTNPGSEPRLNIAPAVQEPTDQLEEVDIPQHVIDNACSNRTRVEQALRGQLFSMPYPSIKAGSPIPEQELQEAGYVFYASQSGGIENPYAPFKSKLDWEVARWAKLRGPSSTAVSELLSIPEVCVKLDLSYKNSRELNALVDKIPNLRPRFKVKEIELGDEIYEVYFRDALECVRALFGEPEFAPHVVTKPERFYADANRTQRVHWDMFTGKWWWAMQKELDSVKEGGTVVPIIVSTDKTQVMLFRNKAAYPVYLTIGNLPKEIRRKPSQREVLAPLKDVGVTGTPMARGDGVNFRCHPIFAAYVGDYLERLLVAGVKYGECPKCEAPRDHLGDPETKYPLRDLEAVLEILAIADDKPADFLKECNKAGIRPIYHPFWADLPYCDIYLSITPDILHQLYQGVIKHLVSWIKSAYSTVEIDAWCRRLPRNHNVRAFMKGITGLEKLTGREHGDIARILLGLIADLTLPNGISSARLVKATRAMLDFLYLAQYPVHSSQTLDLLEDALKRFHDNKSIFVDLGIRSQWNLPKLHALDHFRQMIEWLGTPDNFNTEYTERLHIDFAKNAYEASNKKDEYPQMTQWLERKEKVLQHEKYIEWCRVGCPPVYMLNSLEPDMSPLLMPKHPSMKSVHFDTLAQDYGAVNFRAVLSRYIAEFNYPNISQSRVGQESLLTHIPFTSVPVYFKARFWDDDFPRFQNSNNYDVVHCRPAYISTRNISIPGRFDTVLVNSGHDLYSHNAKDHRIARARVIFSIPDFAHGIFKGDQPVPKYLVYVEWFTAFTNPDPNHGMYRVSPLIRNGSRVASIIPLSNIRRSAHLFPVFGAVADRSWTADNVLDQCSKFYVNNFSDRHMYGIIY